MFVLIGQNLHGAVTDVNQIDQHFNPFAASHHIVTKRPEASYLAKVSRSMINKWADKGKFTVIKVGSRVRILRDEFEDWMEQRDLERSMQ